MFLLGKKRTGNTEKYRGVHSKTGSTIDGLAWREVLQTAGNRVHSVPGCPRSPGGRACLCAGVRLPFGTILLFLVRFPSLRYIGPPPPHKKLHFQPTFTRDRMTWLTQGDKLDWNKAEFILAIPTQPVPK